MKGWIKLHRKLLNWQWYGDINARVTFIHLLLIASPKDCKIGNIILKKGQVLTSQRDLAESVGIDRQCIRTALKKLESSKDITISVLTQFKTIVTICNYDYYQDNNKVTNPVVTQLPTQLPTQQQPSLQIDNQEINNMDNQLLTQQLTQQSTHYIKEDKEIKEDVNINIENLLEKFFEKYNCELQDKFGAVDQNNKMLRCNVAKMLVKYDDKNWLIWFDQCKKSDFLNGRTKQQFKPDLNWLVYPKNFEKIINYCYQSTSSTKQKKQAQQTQVKAKVTQNKKLPINNGKCIPMPQSLKKLY